MRGDEGVQPRTEPPEPVLGGNSVIALEPHLAL